MKKFLLGVVGLIASCLIAVGMSAPAMAADLPAQPYAKVPVMIPALYDWSGFYTGLNGGWGSSHKCWDSITTTGAFIATDGCHNATGGFGGAQLGYRWGVGPSWILGVEGQGDWSGLRGSSPSVFLPGDTNNSKIDSFALLTGQIGYAFNTVLLYVKGGGAVTDDRFSVTTTGAGNVLIGTTGTQTRWGGTVGAGVEFSFAPNWSAAVEYDHLFMGTKAVTFTNPTTATFVSSDSIRQDVDIVSVRVNYRWGGPVIAKY